MKPSPAPKRTNHYEETAGRPAGFCRMASAWCTRLTLDSNGTTMVLPSQVVTAFHSLMAISTMCATWSLMANRIAFIPIAVEILIVSQEVLGGRKRRSIVKEQHYSSHGPARHHCVGCKRAFQPSAGFSFTGEECRALSPDDAGCMPMTTSFVGAPLRGALLSYCRQLGATVPAGSIEVEVMKGFESRERKRVLIRLGAARHLTIYLSRSICRRLALAVGQRPMLHVTYYGGHIAIRLSICGQQLPKIFRREDLVVNIRAAHSDMLTSVPNRSGIDRDKFATASRISHHYWDIWLSKSHPQFFDSRLRRLSTPLRKSVSPNAVVADLAHEQQQWWLRSFYDSIPIARRSLTHELQLMLHWEMDTSRSWV